MGQHNPNRFRFAYLLPGLLLLSALGDAAMVGDAPLCRDRRRTGRYLACHGSTMKVKTPCRYGACCRFARRDDEEARAHNLKYDHNFPCREDVCKLDGCKFNHNSSDGYAGRKIWQCRPAALPKLNQMGGSCQSHALAGWLTTWIEENDKGLAEWFRLKAEGHRLYETLFRRFSEEHELWRQDGYRGGEFGGRHYEDGDYDLFYARMLADYLPGTVPVRTFNGGRMASELALGAMKRNKVMLVEYQMSTERNKDFQKIGYDRDAFTRFLSKKNTAGRAVEQKWQQRVALGTDYRFDYGLKFNKAEFMEYYGNLHKWNAAGPSRAADTVGHAMICVPDAKSDCIGIRNSWGKEWGSDGMVYIKAEEFVGDKDFEFIRFEVPSDVHFRADKIRQLERIHRSSGEGGGVRIEEE